MKKLFFLPFLLFSSVTLQAQHIFFKTYTVYDGLVANPVRCIYQDNKGFIWVGTFDGLSRYDGYKFTNYTTANGLSHNFINSIIEVDNNVLVGENNGAVDIFRDNSLQKGFALPSAVNNIIPFKDRLLLTTDNNGFYQYQNGTIALAPQEKAGTYLGDFITLNDSLLLASGVDNDLILYRQNLTKIATFKNPGLSFFSLFRDSKKRIWACTLFGLKLLQVQPEGDTPISFTNLPVSFNFSPLSNGQVTSMVEEKDGGLWIGTMRGLVHISSQGNIKVYNEKDGLPSAIIHTLYQDKENNLWIGTALGLAKWVSKNNVIFFNTEYNNFKNDVNAVFFFDTKKIILRTDHGLQEFNSETRTFKDIHGTTSNFVPVSGTLPLIIHYGDSIAAIDTTRNVVVPFKKIYTDIPGIISSCQHPDGTILLGTFEGVFAIKNSTVKKISPYRITGLAIDKDKNLWIGTWTDGLYRVNMNNSSDTIYDIEEVKLSSGQKQIRGLYADSEKNIWVGTRYDGVYYFTPRTNQNLDVQHFNRQSGLISDWVNAFAETKNGDMWIGTYLGLDRLVKEQDDYRVFNFSKAVNFFAEIKTIVPTGNNEWVCVANTGIAYFKDENLHQTPPFYATILSGSMGVLGNKLTIVLPASKISLKPNQNTARFEFSAIGFLNEKQILYSYRLKGSGDTTWSKPENIHEASYASLSPGNYTFEVKTIGWNGEQGTPATFSFFISTPFWKQWWFIGLGILALIIFFFALYRYRIRQLLRLQTVRNNIATDLHDDIGSSLTNISILSELSSKNISDPGKAQPFLQRISEEVQASSQAMDDIIWSVNTRNDSLQETMARMRRYAAELFDNSEIKCHLDLEENAGNKKLSMEQRRDVYLIYKETLNNIHKHAQPNNVWINVGQNQNYLLMKIKDDGKGFNTDLITHRNGLKNVRSRVEKWSGKIQIRSEESKGTSIEIKIPLRD